MSFEDWWYIQTEGGTSFPLITKKEVWQASEKETLKRVEKEIDKIVLEVWKECTDHHEERRAHRVGALLKQKLGIDYDWKAK